VTPPSPPGHDVTPSKDYPKAKENLKVYWVMSACMGGAYDPRIGWLGHAQVRTIRPCLEAHYCRGGKRWQALYRCKRCTERVCPCALLYLRRRSYFSFRILRLTNPPAEVQESYKQAIQEFARRGFRTLGESSLSCPLNDWLYGPPGVACKENDGDWKCLGLLPM
jgi:hypothetical protein